LSFFCLESRSQFFDLLLMPVLCFTPLGPHLLDEFDLEGSGGGRRRGRREEGGGRRREEEGGGGRREEGGGTREGQGRDKGGVVQVLFGLRDA
jgi:hypothetical protein